MGKPKPWADPADQSWATPILRHQEAAAQRQQQEPAMLHMVYRIKETAGRPYWEKDMLKELGIYEKPYNPVVLKNTPETNQKLQQVKHLIKIKPVTFPYGLPKDEDDYKHCYLNENGEFIVRQRIDDNSAEIRQAWAEVKLVEENKQKESVWTMKKETIDKECDRVKQTWRLNDEYFPEQYVYKYNQDGKEWRYKGNHNVGHRRQDWY